MPGRTIRRILVVGAGTMGHGIAQVLAIHGYQVDLVDVSTDCLGRATERIASSLARLAEFGAIETSEVGAIGDRIRTTTDLAGAAGEADLVVEAIVEDTAAKSALFSQLDRSLRPGVTIASNTSSLNVFQLAEESAPGRLPDLVIHHYFLPPTIVPLVEIVGGPKTDPERVAWSVEFIRGLDHEPVVLDRFTPNFIVNNFQIALGAVAARLLAEGVASPEMIDRALKTSLGVRLPIVGVLQSLDFTGLDLFARMLANNGLDPAYFRHLLAEGREGARSGRGLYDYGGRTLDEVEAARDRKYWQIRGVLKAIGAFDPL